MSFPAEGMESAFKNHIDDVRMFLDSRHMGGYAVYNLSQRTYRVAKFQNRASKNNIPLGWIFSQITATFQNKANKAR